jgi:predicted lipid-binding transport protein (Tim44 family)
MINKSFLQDKEFENLKTAELMNIIQNDLLFQRGRALFELSRRSGVENSLIEIVTAAITNPQNMAARTIGTVSLSFLGIAGLLEADTEETRQLANELIESWPKDDRTTLTEFLSSVSRQLEVNE